jgi:hypothetical protein
MEKKTRIDFFYRVWFSLVLLRITFILEHLNLWLKCTTMFFACIIKRIKSKQYIETFSIFSITPFPVIFYLISWTIEEIGQNFIIFKIGVAISSRALTHKMRVPSHYPMLLSKLLLSLLSTHRPISSFFLISLS